MNPEGKREKNMKLCMECDQCCNHIAIEIDKPTSKQDYDNIIWYLLHENVSVSVDNEDDWIVEFQTKCRPLREDKLCDIYLKRPKICREYSQENCVKFGEGEPEVYKFTTRQEFIEYLEAKNIDWKFKNLKE